MVDNLQIYFYGLFICLSFAHYCNVCLAVLYYLLPLSSWLESSIEQKKRKDSFQNKCLKGKRRKRRSTKDNSSKRELYFFLFCYLYLKVSSLSSSSSCICRRANKLEKNSKITDALNLCVPKTTQKQTLEQISNRQN